jgi:signal transduction histidine kinase
MSKHSSERLRPVRAPVAAVVPSAPPNDSAELRHVLSQVDDFLAMLSNELRQPLAAALAAIEIQKQSPRADRQERARRVIEQQVRYIARLVGDLSEVSRMSRGTFELRRERLELRGLLRETLAMTEPLFDDRRHSVTAVLGPHPVFVHGDPIRVKQIFSNLLKNAASYTAPGGVVSVRLDATGEQVRVRIKDNGAGIAPDALERIFKLFERGPQRADGHNAGIGLAVVRRLVELHGGAVSAASDGPGHGSEFTVVFPRDTSN